MTIRCVWCFLISVIQSSVFLVLKCRTHLLLGWMQCTHTILSRGSSVFQETTQWGKRRWYFGLVLSSENLSRWRHLFTSIYVSFCSRRKIHRTYGRLGLKWFLLTVGSRLCLSADEFDNFLERINVTSEHEIWDNEEYENELRHWASYRGQTLSRTGKSHAPNKREVRKSSQGSTSVYQIQIF